MGLFRLRSPVAEGRCSSCADAWAQDVHWSRRHGTGDHVERKLSSAKARFPADDEQTVTGCPGELRCHKDMSRGNQEAGCLQTVLFEAADQTAERHETYKTEVVPMVANDLLDLSGDFHAASSRHDFELDLAASAEDRRDREARDSLQRLYQVQRAR